MCLLGLISIPTFANQQKIKHTENYKGEVEKEAIGYKGEETICPKVNLYTTMMDAMGQVAGRAKPTVDCNKLIQFAGGINFDSQWSGLNRGYMGENNTRYTLNDAYLNATAHVNPWVSAFLEVSYNNIQDTALNSANFDGFINNEDDTALPGIYSAAYSLDALSLQQGYITLGNPEMFPLYLRLGKQTLDYGRFTIHPITRSMTQVMTETAQTAAELSFISEYNSMDLHGSFFVFQNQITKGEDDVIIPSDESNLGNVGKTNYGAQIGFGRVNNHFGWDFGAGYMYNLFGVNDIAYATAFLKGSNSIENNGSQVDVSESYYVKRVSGATAYGMINSGPFTLSAHYATALQHFDPIDFSFPTISSDDDDSDDGIKPWAYDIRAGYGFNYWNKDQNIYVEYQQSGDAALLFVPERRWVAGYGIKVLDNTDLGLEYSHDQAYDDQNLDDEDTNRVALRVAVKFG